jgi:hypothetical protein
MATMWPGTQLLYTARSTEPSVDSRRKYAAREQVRVLGERPRLEVGGDVGAADVTFRSPSICTVGSRRMIASAAARVMPSSAWSALARGAREKVAHRPPAIVVK